MQSDFYFCLNSFMKAAETIVQRSFIRKLMLHDFKLSRAQSAGAVNHTNCISAVE